MDYRNRPDQHDPAWRASQALKNGAHLAGKTALVTGAASGIGRAITLRLLAETAADIIAVDRNHDGLVELKDDPEGWRVTLAHGDVADDAFLDDLPHDVDLLVNNAGQLTPAALRDLDMAAARRTLRVMLEAPLYLTCHVLPYMRNAGGGLILNMGSVYSLAGGDEKGAYGIAKHGIHALTKQIALEESRRGIRAVTICPAHVDSPLLDQQAIDEGALRGVTPEAQRRFLADQLASGEFVQAHAVAGACLWLTTRDARSVTGCAFQMDGGWLAGTRSRVAHPITPAGRAAPSPH